MILKKSDFDIIWYSQHRNKHQNCCRITHIESKLKSNGTSNKSRVANQREAFIDLTEKVIRYYYKEHEVERMDLTEVIRNYNMKNNIVHDKSSGLKETYKNVVTDNNLSNMIETRRESCL